MCACGKKAWGRTKLTNLVSLASETNSTAAKNVNVSDEAFVLLHIDNGVDVWIEKAKTAKAPEPEEEGDNQNKKKAVAANRRLGE